MGSEGEGYADTNRLADHRVGAALLKRASNRARERGGGRLHDGDRELPQRFRERDLQVRASGARVLWGGAPHDAGVRVRVRARDHAGALPERICTQVTFPGGWTCSTASSVELKEGAATAGCNRRGASFRVYKASPGGPPDAEQSVQFRSADNQIWCGANVAGPGTRFFCASPRGGTGSSQHSAILYKDGHAKLCNVAVATLSTECYQNWGVDTPFLGLGKENYINGVLCKYRIAGMTCTLTSGPGKGRGFRINRNGAVQVA
jgi:hypothetical protein